MQDLFICLVSRKIHPLKSKRRVFQSLHFDVQSNGFVPNVFLELTVIICLALSSFIFSTAADSPSGFPVYRILITFGVRSDTLVFFAAFNAACVSERELSLYFQILWLRVVPREQNAPSTLVRRCSLFRNR